MVKRFISSFLTVTVLGSCITFSNNEATVKADSTTTIDSNSQILYQGELNEVQNDKVTTSKTIVETGVENEFEITLQVTTEEDIKNISISPDAATVLVLDRSGSMNDKDGDKTSRFKEMKDAANSFLSDYAKVESGSNVKRLVSIVSFASNVKNETYDNDNGVNNWINVVSDLTKATGIINNLAQPDGGTNIEGALIMANNIVQDGNNEVLKGIKNVNIILLTDGCPTFHTNNSNTNSISTIIGVEGGGSEAYTTDWKPVGGTVDGVSANSSNISKTIKDNGINLYTIAFSTSNAKFYTKDPVWMLDDGSYENINPSTWMEGFATRNFSANDVDELTKQFEKINKLIALSAKAWKVTDPMGSNIIYKEIASEKTNNSYTFSNNTLNWDLKNSSPVESKTESGNTKYTYTLKYRVILDTTNTTDSYDKVLTNGNTVLDYYLFSKQGEEQSVELKHTNFYVPEVKGLFGALNFTKVNEKNQAMKDVVFKLTGTATGSDKAVEITAISDANGNVSFANIPAGEYKLTETAPSGYFTAGPWDVVVSYGNVTKDANLGNTIVNYPEYRNISVEKIWTGLPEGSTDYPESVTVRLLANNVDTGKTLSLNSNNSWKGTFSNLPYLDDKGVITYSIEEDTVVGYNASITRLDEYGDKFEIKNLYNPERVMISGKKTWVDESGGSIEGKVPDIEITLQRTLADNWNDETKIEKLDTVKLTDGKTEYSFTELPKTATNGKEYKYRVRESEVNGYTPTYNDKFDIVNTYTPGETELSVNKAWENVDINNDILPEVKIELYQDGIKYKDVVLTKATGYSYKFEDLPKYAKTGIEYKYTVEESLKEGTVGYETNKVDNKDGSFTITNTFDTTTISVKGQKQWVGVLDGEQVPAVTIKLLQDGKELEGKVITIEGGVKENKPFAFENLPKYSTAGKEYTYTVVEETLNGYKSSGEGNLSNNYIITNTFTPETIPIMGNKTWSNVSNISKVPTITIYLERSLDGVTWTRVDGQVRELTAGNTKYQFDNLPKYASDSREYKYRVVETPIVGYTSSNNGSYNILNTYEPGETSIRVTKKWTNVDPNTNTVPEVNIILKQDGIDIGSRVLDKENGYTHIFDKLAKYAPTGQEYVYTVEEVLGDGVVGYTKDIKSGDDGFIVENIFDKTNINITFNKVWENVSDDAEVPDIKLHLYQNEVELTDKAVTLKGGSEDNREVSHVFKDLPKYSTDGKAYDYTIKEDSVTGYESSGEAVVDDNNTATITNRFIPGSTNISGTKIWKNVSNENSVPTIKLVLQSSLDGENWVAVSDKEIELVAGTTNYEFTNLPKYSTDTREYKYRVIEEDVNGYETSYDEDNNIINTYTPGETSVKVSKKWTNVDPVTSSVPEVKILLMRDGEEVNNIVLDKDNEYTYTFTNLDKYAETGKPYEYTVEEVLGDGVVGYTKDIKSGDDGFIVENIFVTTKIDINFAKVWENVSDDDKVPNIKLHLYQNGVELTDKAVTLKGGAKDNRELSYVFKDLPKYSTDGTEYVYTVKEDSVTGYKSSGDVTVDDKYNATITNTFTPGSININGEKTWNKVSDLDAVPTITIRLQRSTDGILWSNVEGKVVQLVAGTLDYEFKDLPEYSVEGNKYQYRVAEDEVDGYKTLVDLDNNITNIYTPGETSVKVTKKWANVDLNKDNVPEVKVVLKQNGEAIGNATLNSENEYTYTFEGLAKYAETGEEYVYTVEEENIIGYTGSGEGNAENDYTITNTFTPGSTDISGKKTWDNVSNLNEVPTITIFLESSTDGENWTKVSGKTIELKAGNTEYKFEDIPQYSVDGKVIKYRVVEAEVNGYTVSNYDNYNITNRYSPDKILIKVTKVWKNVDINTENLPEVKIVLKQDGKDLNSVILDKENGYTYTFDNLDKTAPTGKDYKYTIDEVLEDGVEGYRNEITSDNNEFIVVNTFDSNAVVDVTFNKVWENVPKDTEVPDIKLHLYQNGVELTDKAVTLNGGIKENGTESYVFKDLPKYSTDGKVYVYTVTEDNVSGYTSSGEANANNYYTVTNTYTGGDKVIIKGTKTWVNVDDVNNVPNITIRVLRDGKEIHSIAVPSGNTTYEIASDSMVKYAPDGHEYVYELTEDKIDGFESERDGYNFTNTKVDIKTGDNNMIILYASLAILSLLLLSAISFKKRRESIKK